MHQVRLNLTDRLYKQARRKASKAGFASVSDYVADVLTNEASEGPENLDHLFTPQRLAHIDKVAAEVKNGGKTYTLKETDEYLAKRRDEWRHKKNVNPCCT